MNALRRSGFWAAARAQDLGLHLATLVGVLVGVADREERAWTYLRDFTAD